MQPINLPARFELDREIGRGGMATVYRAHDNHLGRFVAIKVLSPELFNTVNAERFQREIALMAKLVHPGIVALFDSGEVAGHLYYVMPLVAGETLRARLTRERRVNPQEAAALGADIAEALAYAHGMNIVHRDVKPENIFTVSGRAVLADFGIARMAGDHTAAAPSPLTTMGMVLGTASYMSPEQATGDANINGQSDLYSFGCVLYELLTGAPPFVAPTLMGVIGKHVTEAPRRPSEKGLALPPEIDALIMELLAKEPRDRPANAGEVARRLRAASHASSTQSYAPVPKHDAARTIIVRTIESPHGDEECRALAADVGHAIARSLCAVPGLRIVLEGTDPRVNGADEVQGSARRSGTRVRITLRVLGADSAVRWAEVTDGSMDDLFSLEDAAAASVLRHFGDGPVSSEVESLIADARLAFNLFRPGGGPAPHSHLNEAMALLVRALAIDPKNARVLCTLGNYTYVAGLNGITPRDESLAKGRELIFAALAADERCVDVHCSMGKIALYHDDDFHSAARHIRRAVELDPNDPEALRLLSIVYKILGRTEDAVNAARASAERPPHSAFLWNAFGDALLADGRNAEAVDVLQHAIDLTHGYGPAMERLERAHVRLGDFTRALEIRSARIRSTGHRDRADMLDREGESLGAAESVRRDVRRELDILLREAEHSDPFADHVGRNAGDRIVSGHAELGEWRKAMDWVERAYEHRPGRLRRMLTDLPVDYRGLAVDPRYARLMRVAGLGDRI